MTSAADTVIMALTRHGLIAADERWSARPAAGGSTARTFIIADPDGVPVCVARLARAGYEQRLRHEASVLRELMDSGCPCAPDGVTHFDDASLPGGQLLAHDYAPGAPFAKSAATSAGFDRLGACLASIHRHAREGYSLWPSPADHRGSRADCFHARLRGLREHPVANDDALPEARAMLDQLASIDLPESAGWREPGFALIHGDLSPGNILWDADRGVTLIDWEYTRDGDPAEDLAYLIAEHDLSPGAASDLAEAYADHGGDLWALARVPIWLPFVALESALWWAAYTPPDDADLDQPTVESFLQRARRYLSGS